MGSHAGAAWAVSTLCRCVNQRHQLERYKKCAGGQGAGLRFICAGYVQRLGQGDGRIDPRHRKRN